MLRSLGCNSFGVLIGTSWLELVPMIPLLRQFVTGLLLRYCAESHNAGQTRRGLKRSPWYGRANSAKAHILGDILACALNLARFVREATTAASHGA